MTIKGHAIEKNETNTETKENKAMNKNKLITKKENIPKF